MLYFVILILALDDIVLYLELRKVRKERDNAETRAVTHFKKLNKIENILKNSDKTQENFFITIDKIKRVIFQNANSKR